MAEKRIETVEMRAGDVKTGFGNPRKITKKKKDELRNSIETFGDFGSFIIDENDNIIGGNMRLSVIKEMDPDTIILCKRLIGYSETELRAINIKDKAKRVLAYEVLSETDWNIPNTQNAFIPNVYEDITKQINFKLMAMEGYKSQLREYPAARSLEGIKALAVHRGVTVGAKYAEAFMLIREVAV